MPRRSWGQKKPPLGSKILPGHPLANSLIGCWLFNENGGWPTNLVTGVPPSTQSGTPLWGADALYFSEAAADGVIYDNTIPGGLGTGPFSVVARLMRPTIGSIFWNRGLVTNDSVLDGNSGLLWYIYNNSNPHVGMYPVGEVVLDDWSVPGTICQTRTGTTGYLYKDGRLVTSGSDTRNMTLTPVSFGCDIYDANRTDAAFWYVYLYRRCLTAGEIAWLQEEPYAFLSPPQPQRSYPVPTPPVGTTIYQLAALGVG